MRRLVIAASVGALAVGGTALASPGGGPLGLLGEDREERRTELARDLASKLDGVSATEVSRALEQVQRERQAERRAERARELAAALDGVSTEQAEQALEKAQQQLRRARGEDFRPRGDFIETLARELDKSEDQIEQALRKAHQAHLERKLDEAVKEGRISKERADRIRDRLEDGGPPFGERFRRGPGPGGLGPGGDGPGPGAFDIPAGPPPGIDELPEE